MTTPRADPTAALLPDGRVLIAGGEESCGNPGGTAELFDPNTGRFTATGSMLTQGSGFATLLDNGKVLFAGGGKPEPELYDPLTGTFSLTGPYAEQMCDPDCLQIVFAGATATLLPDGRVLIASPAAELYDPVSGTFSLTGPMTLALPGAGSFLVQIVGATASLLLNGSVLLTGGYDPEDCDFNSFADAQIYDPSTGEFTGTGSMTEGRSYHTATVLADGTVLIAGGSDASAELYDPATGTFSWIGDMNSPRSNHTATLLQDCTVLIAGGAGGSDASAEIFTSSSTAAGPNACDLQLSQSHVATGDSFSAHFAGSSLTAKTFFDIRFTTTDGSLSAIRLNWQAGVAATHGLPPGTAPGTWIITGIRAHQAEADHTGNFVPVKVTLAVIR
jgi:hypothetical protein